MEQLSKIAKGWTKVLLQTTTEEDKRKASICKGCPHAVSSTFVEFINDKLVDVNGMVCNDCGCPLIAKIRSGGNCPKNKW